jgi:hypothetical protein
MKLIDMLDDLDDVQSVYTNAEFAEEALKTIGLSLRILGIDPGSITMGFGIIEQEGYNATYVASGCIKVGKLEWAATLT